jgi:hypothetical protein
MKLAPVFLISAMLGSLAPAQTLDTTTFVVVGEGLAAGMANFGLSSVVQTQSFPARMAGQMKTAFPQPLIQPPGIGDVPGYPGQEVRLNTYPQGSVRVYPPAANGALQATPPIFVLNVSIPGQTLNDCVTLRPAPPIVQRNMKQTVVNLIIGFPQLTLDNVALWTQFEYAKAMMPTVTLIELGYYEALDAAIAGDPARMPDPGAFGVTYTNIVSGFRAMQSQVIVMTIPNPLDTGYFSSPAVAGTIIQAAPSVLLSGYNLSSQDFITRNGLAAITSQFLNGIIAPLPQGSTLSAATALDITNRVTALNTQIVNAAKANGAVVYDLNGFLHRVKISGAPVGSGTVTGDYLGGFYSLDGVYPGATGHALIANDLLSFLNQTYRRSFPLIDLSSVTATDPVIQYLKPQGEVFTDRMLRRVADVKEGRQ